MKNTENWRNFTRLCQKAVEKNRLAELLTFLLTDEEQEQIPMRVKLIQALIAGKMSQRTIAKDLGISISKITRGSNALKHISPELQEFLKGE